MKTRAFTLIELLIVMAIIGVMITLTVPAFNGLGKANALGSTGNNLLDQLAQARQTAVAQNRVTELRIYKRRENPAAVADASMNPEKFRSFRIMVYSEPVWDAAKQDWISTATPLAPRVDFPKRIVMTEDLTYSTLIYPYANTSPARTFLVEDLSPNEKNVSYQAIRFKPNGSTDLGITGTPDGDKWFLTIISDSDSNKASKPATRPASNYFTVMLDPVSGRARAYRP